MLLPSLNKIFTYLLTLLTYLKIWQNLPTSNSKTDLLTVNTYSIKIPCYFQNQNISVSRADNSVKIWRNLPINNPKPDLLNVNAYSKFGENPMLFTQVIVGKWKYGHLGQITLSKIDEICPLAIPNQISTISIHIPSLVKIHCLLKSSSGNEKRTDRWTHGWQRETIISRHFCVAGYKKNNLKVHPFPIKLIYLFFIYLFFIIFFLACSEAYCSTSILVM